jgi:hypothetical protein
MPNVSPSRPSVEVHQHRGRPSAGCVLSDLLLLSASCFRVKAFGLGNAMLDLVELVAYEAAMPRLEQRPKSAYSPRSSALVCHGLRPYLNM